MSANCRSGRKPSPHHQEDVSLQEGGFSERAEVSDTPLKELKDVEGTGLNAL